MTVSIEYENGKPREEILRAVEQWREIIESRVPAADHAELIVDALGDEVWVEYMGAPQLHMARKFERVKGVWRLDNITLSASDSMRGKGLAHAINKVGADALLALGGSEIRLSAALSMGGYKWLRDGFWPKDGKEELDRIARKHGGTVADKWIALSESDAQEAMLNPSSAAEYKPLFAGAKYDAIADIKNPRTYAAITGQPTGTVNDLIQARIIQKQAGLEWVTNDVAEKLVEILRKTEPRIIAKISDFMRRNRQPQQYDWKRLEALRTIIHKLRSEGWQQVGKELDQLAMQLAIAEAKQWPKDLQDMAPTQLNVVAPTTATLREIARSKPIHGRLMKDWVAKMRDEDMVRIMTKVQTGMLAGETLDSMMRTLFGTERLQYKDGSATLTNNQLKTVVRTMTHHIASDVRAEFVRVNAKEIGAKERFVATLDSRTTPLCGSLDGKLFPVGEGPQPPLHYNCRSARVFYIDAESQLMRPYKASVESDLVVEYSKQAGIPRTTKRSKLPFGHKTKFDKFAQKKKVEYIGQTPAATKFSDWFARQSVAFQKASLGEKRFQLYRYGGLSLDKFQDISGRKLTLEELYAKHPKAVKQSGVIPKQ